MELTHSGYQNKQIIAGRALPDVKRVPVTEAQVAARVAELRAGRRTTEFEAMKASIAMLTKDAEDRELRAAVYRAVDAALLYPSDYRNVAR